MTTQMVHPRIMKNHKNLPGDVTNNFPYQNIILSLRNCIQKPYIQSPRNFRKLFGVSPGRILWIFIKIRVAVLFEKQRVIKCQNIKLSLIIIIIKKLIYFCKSLIIHPRRMLLSVNLSKPFRIKMTCWKNTFGTFFYEGHSNEPPRIKVLMFKLTAFIST